MDSSSSPRCSRAPNLALADACLASLHKLRGGATHTAILAALGLILGAGGVFLTKRNQPRITTAHVQISFPGFERGEYPDGSKFQPGDLRRPSIIATALTQAGLPNTPESIAATRNALIVEGIVPPSALAARDRARDAGLPVPQFIPDQYELRFSPSRSADLDDTQRRRLLDAIVAAYRESFKNTHGDLPRRFGQAAAALRAVDYIEYELVLRSEIKSTRTFLEGRLENAKSFRATSTNLSFKDLIEQTELFERIQLNEVLGLIRSHGLSRDRDAAMTKMQNELRRLSDRLKLAQEEEALIKNLLLRTQSRAQEYAMDATIGAQTSGQAPLIDRTMVATLLANDAHSRLVRESIDAGLRVTTIQNEILRMTEQYENMRSFLANGAEKQSASLAEFETALKLLEESYAHLIENIRKTQGDFAAQFLGEAVRLNQPPQTATLTRPALLGGLMGAFLGACLGMGLSLLGCGSRPARAVAAPTSE